jgi:hypothetical protein
MQETFNVRRLYERVSLINRGLLRKNASAWLSFDKAVNVFNALHHAFAYGGLHNELLHYAMFAL